MRELLQNKVYIVGGGPGAADLITLRGKEALSRADVVIYAGSLVPDEMLEWCRPDAVLIDSKDLTLEQITEKTVSAIRAGKSVVRLHSGDPSIYGATHEQIVELKKNKIDWEIIPGVSSFQAAAASMGRELTIPDQAQTVILSRASGRTKVPPKEELIELAKIGTTLILYLSATLAKKIQTDLLTGYPPETPTAIAYRVTWPDEKIIYCRLEELEKTVRQEKITRHALILVGKSLTPPDAARSKLYDKTFSHMFRRAVRKEGVADVRS